MPTIKIDPLNRIEGHVSVEVITDPSGNITTTGGLGVSGKDVTVAGTMFRGFELIMAKRDPRDAPVITQRI